MPNVDAERESSLTVVDDATPDRALSIAEIAIGDAVEQRFAFDERTREAFRTVASDRAPLHDDGRFARAQGFSGPIVQGLCVATRFSRLIGMYLPGRHAILERIDLKFRRPTHEGEALVFRAEVTRVLRPMRVVRLQLSVRSAAGVHLSGEAQCLIR